MEVDVAFTEVLLMIGVRVVFTSVLLARIRCQAMVRSMNSVNGTRTVCNAPVKTTAYFMLQN